MRFLTCILPAVALAVAALPVSAGSLYDVPKYAAILVNADTGEVMYSRKADETRFPASITKVMSLYVAFEEMKAGRLKETDRIRISARAASQPPSKLGLKPGETISVADAMGIMATKSANDISLALAEHIGGSQAGFAARMNATAKRLGMTGSHFVNPHGLPDPLHVTTARDIATLSRALIRDFPERYKVFGKAVHDYQGTPFKSHNKLLGVMPGVDGIKTGFTNAAGFTLAASAVQDGTRLVAVVLGGPNPGLRDGNVSDLLQVGFSVLTRRSRGELTTVAANFAEPDDLPDAVLERLATRGPAADGLVLANPTSGTIAR
jgi:D-alanyl-D-alanine carboxypeptidase (penicillin-binding protein 5/6)